MPWTAKKIFSALKDFPNAELTGVTLQCASLAPNQLGFKPLTIYINLKISIWKAHHLPRARCIDDIYIDTWTPLIPKTTHVCMLPTNQKRKGLFKTEKAVEANHFQSFIPPI